MEESPGVKPSPSETTPTAPLVPQQEVKPLAPSPEIRAINIAQNKLQQPTETERTIKERDYSTLPQKGFVGVIIRYWEKYCGTVDPKDEALYKEIYKETEKFENALDKVDGSIRDMLRTEKKLSGISQKSRESTGEKLDTIKKNLKKANELMET